MLELFESAFGPLPAAFKIIYLFVAAIVLVSISVYCLIQQSDTTASMAARAQYLLFTFLLILSPNYPWYFVVLVPLGCLAPWSPALCLTLLSAILYGAPPIAGDPSNILIHSLLYGAAIAALIFDLCRRFRSREISKNHAADAASAQKK